MITASQFSTLLIPGIYHHFELGMSLVPSLRGQLFNVQGSNLAAENGVGLGGVSPEAWDQYKSNRTKGRITFSQLYTQTYTHVEYPVQFVIEKKLLQFDQYGKINQYARRLGLSAEQKMELDAASLLNNAFSTSYNFSDGKPLISATHPRNPDSSGTYSNRGTSALTADAVSATRVAMMHTKDDKGNEIGIMPNELWVPPELEDAAIKITQSLRDPGNANNDANAQGNGRWKVIPWLRLTDTNNWFMADGVMRNETTNWYNVGNSEPMVVDETTTEIVYETKLFYSFGVDDWRAWYGHEVA
jgi:phage major head subunit gpT-like protein